MAEPPAFDPDAAFALLGEPTRLAILRVVVDAEEPLAFSAIRERLGDPDSGRFNYHLEKLRGPYLRKRADGYAPTQAGREVVRAVLAGTLTGWPAAAPAPIDAPCPDCGGALALAVDDHARIACADCGATVLWNEFPPAGLAQRDPAEAARAVDRWTRHRFRLAMTGVCPSCAAAVEREPAGRDPDEPAGVATRYACPNCGDAARVPLVGHLLAEPAVLALFARHGVDLLAEPYWTLRARAHDWDVTVVEAAPWRATVTIELDGERLVVTVDDALAVVGVEAPD